MLGAPTLAERGEFQVDELLVSKREIH
jgi:hypothetical protein